MTWAILLAAAVLAGVAAAGVLRPFGSRGTTLDRLADPLEDERESLLRALRDLDEERSRGELNDDTYRLLRNETESRAVAVLRALEARDGAGELTANLRELRSPTPTSGNGSGPASGSGPGSGRGDGSRAGRRMLPAALVAGAIVAVIVPLLAGAVTGRSPDQPITGAGVGQPGGSDLSFFEQRVAQHPNDVAARLDLAERYLEGGDLESAVEQYLATLQLDPRNAEAQATLGFLLYQSGKAEEGLRNVERALQNDPGYPEALYYKGIILLRGLDRPDDAAGAFREYLDAAPFGARRDEVEGLLARMRLRGEIGSGSPSPSPSG